MPGGPTGATKLLMHSERDGVQQGKGPSKRHGSVLPTRRQRCANQLETPSTLLPKRPDSEQAARFQEERDPQGGTVRGL
jgi:hypothetical protein